MSKYFIFSVLLCLFCSFQLYAGTAKKEVSRTGKCGTLLATPGPQDYCKESNDDCYIEILWDDGTTSPEYYDSVYLPGKGIGYYDIGGVTTEPVPNSSKFKVNIGFKATTIMLSATNLTDFINQVINLP